MNHRTYHDSHKAMLLYKKICFSENCVNIILHCNEFLVFLLFALYCNACLLFFIEIVLNYEKCNTVYASLASNHVM